MTIIATAVPTIGSRRKRRPCGNCISSVLFDPRPTICPVTPAAM